MWCQQLEKVTSIPVTRLSSPAGVLPAPPPRPTAENDLSAAGRQRGPRVARLAAGLPGDTKSRPRWIGSMLNRQFNLPDYFFAALRSRSRVPFPKRYSISASITSL